MKADILAQLQADRAAKRPVARVTDLDSGAESLVYLADTKEEISLPSGLIEAARRALEIDRSQPFETGGGRYFIHAHNPPLRLIIVGAVHIAQPLSRIAALAGYAVTVVDPRRAFASGARFAGVAVSQDWPDEALTALAPDSRTAVVTLTHDPKLDNPALAVALRSPAFYVGSLGSKRTHAKRCEGLAEMGVDATAIARIHGPIGLSIGAASPAEIAVSIIAQITQVRRQGAQAAA